MSRKSVISVVLALSVLANVFCLPADLRPRRQTAGDQVSSSTVKSNESSDVAVPPEPYNDDDDFETVSQAPSGGGSNISSLFSLLGAFLPGSSSSNKIQEILYNLIKEFMKINKPRKIIKRDISDNEIDVDYPKTKPSRQEIIEIANNESDESDDTSEEKRNDSEENSDSNVESEEDYDEPPGGDGQGGGLLGLLAGLSGGEDGQSDLGSLLATIGGIVANLSGDGIDLNSLIATGIGLFVGLLSEGEENPGAVIASYLLTSLETITGGGSKNNGKFFGTFLSKLIKGTSAALDPDASPEEDGRVPPKDSVGFFVSLLAGLLGDMSGGSSAPHRRRWIDHDL